MTSWTKFSNHLTDKFVGQKSGQVIDRIADGNFVGNGVEKIYKISNGITDEIFVGSFF